AAVRPRWACGPRGSGSRRIEAASPLGRATPGTVEVGAANVERGAGDARFLSSSPAARPADRSAATPRRHPGDRRAPSAHPGQLRAPGLGKGVALPPDAARARVTVPHPPARSQGRDRSTLAAIRALLERPAASFERLAVNLERLAASFE